jgi:hypothetical protein
MCLSEANGAKLATTVPTGRTVSHWNGPEWAQHNQTGPKFDALGEVKGIVCIASEHR